MFAPSSARASSIVSGQLLHDDRVLNRASLVAFVAGASAAFITGAVLTIDGDLNA